MAILGGEELGDKLAAMRREAEEREAERMANAAGIPYLNLGLISVQLAALKLLNEQEERDAQIATVKLEGKTVTAVVYNPEDKKTLSAIDKIKKQGYQVALYAVSMNSLKKAWEHYKEIIEIPVEITSRIEISEREFTVWREKIKNISDVTAVLAGAASALSTTQILSVIFGASIILDASDIHFEATKANANLRFRIDGILHDVSRFPLDTYRQILNRVKLLSGLKINISNAPQDGRFTIKVNTDEIEVRVAVSPSEFGEAIVLRVLNPKSISLTLTQLGLREDDNEIAMKEIKRPNGMILVTGPTGSGKTTTLYAFLKTVSDPESKIITIEDPIEYHLPGIEQTQVDPAAGYTFASGLRSILRQDPDMLLVGEVRDLETAEIAIHASLTGHLVFSTLHTNNAVGAVPRLIDLGIKPSIIGPALSLVIAQRLIRKLCPNCKKEAPISDELAKKIKSIKAKLPGRVKMYATGDKLYEAVGCDKCNQGYKGRIGIYEFLEMGGKFEELINKDATEFAIKDFALKNDFVEMQTDGILKALAGITSLKEVENVTGALEW